MVRSIRPAWTSRRGCVDHASGSSTRIGPGFAESGAPIVVDTDLLRAFEIDQEVHEYVYASTWMPSWLWAPDESMHALFGLDETHVRGAWVDGGELT